MLAFYLAIRTVGIVFYTDDVVNLGCRDLLQDNVSDSNNAMFLGWRHNKEISCFCGKLFYNPLLILKPNLRFATNEVVRLVLLIVILITGTRARIDVDALIAVAFVKLKPDFFAPRLCHLFVWRVYVHMILIIYVFFSVSRVRSIRSVILIPASYPNADH